MQALGFVFLVLIALAVVITLVAFFVSLPGLSRYRRIRRM
ncbi:hypothetical protein BH23ACT2_BH23ACT2_22880 [soil metagenome]